jgi:hypothetical protein
MLDLLCQLSSAQRNIMRFYGRACLMMYNERGLLELLSKKALMRRRVECQAVCR